MKDIAALVADNLDLWTGAIERKSGAGRGGGKRISLYGIEQLRTLILDLAVRGKLVPQDPADEPVRELLRKIANERASLKGLQKRRSGKDGIDALNNPAEVPVPKGWQAAPLSEVSTIIRGVTYGKSDASDDERSGLIGLLRGHNIQSEINLDKLVYVPIDKVSPDQILRPGDIVVAMSSGSADLVGKAAQYGFEHRASFGAFCGVVRPISEFMQPYLAFFCKTPFYRSQTHKGGKGIGIQNLGKGDLEKLTCLIPPLAEQRRIVAKVDELMVLCDALERESADALAAHQTLVETLLATLVNSADAADLATNWARLESHFDTLFTTEASIDALKQTILDLAVRGKLVEQDSRDEPAIKKLKGTQATAPFSIPENWQCVPLQALGRQIGGGTPSKSRSDFWDGPIPWVSPKDMKRDYLSAAEMSVTESALKGSAVKLIAPESLMFVVRGMILAHSFPVAITKGPVTINQDMKAIELDQPAMAEYLLRALKGLKPLMLARVERSSHGTCRLDANAYGSFPIPIPPVAEQRRIVARIDELMALCDALMARIIDAAETRRHLADAITRRAAA